jgi:ABC-type transporter Mla subunit MlaD
MNEDLIAAIKELTEAVDNLTEATDQLRGRQGEMFDQSIQMGDYVSTLNHRLEQLEKTISKKL